PPGARLLPGGARGTTTRSKNARERSSQSSGGPAGRAGLAHRRPSLPAGRAGLGDSRALAAGVVPPAPGREGGSGPADRRPPLVRAAAAERVGALPAARPGRAEPRGDPDGRRGPGLRLPPAVPGAGVVPRPTLGRAVAGSAGRLDAARLVG